MKAWVCLGQIVAAHGIKGQVKIKTFTEDPQNLTKYGNLVDSKQQLVEIISFSKNSPTSGIAAIAGFTTRNQAESLKGIQLFVHQDQLPELCETEIYHESLIGLPLMANGKNLGKVIAVHDFGAGGICEVQTAEKMGMAHLSSCTVFDDHLECDEANFLV
jgi:16S rRNA processing protein RimM